MELNLESKRILTLAAIRRFIDENKPEDFYFDFWECVKLPSLDGQFSSYDAIIIVSSKEEESILKSIFEQIDNPNVVFIYL